MDNLDRAARAFEEALEVITIDKDQDFHNKIKRYMKKYSRRKR